MLKKVFKRGTVFLLLVLIVALIVTQGDMTPPTITLGEGNEYFGQTQELKFSVEDKKTGIRWTRALIRQDNKEKEILRFDFPKREAYKKDITGTVKPASIGFKDGKATLILLANDHALFGNETRTEKEITIDTVPPQIQIQTLNHYITLGGSCLAMYNVSKDTVKSGVLVDDHFFQGYPLEEDGDLAAYFSLPWNASNSPSINLMAQDMAGNSAKVSFPYLIRNRRFREIKMNIPDSFLDRKMPEFASRYDHLLGNNLEIFLLVNNQLRIKNNDEIIKICSTSHPQRLWEGPFLRMNGSSEAQFADIRTYYYSGKKIDKQAHLGVDISAVKRFPVEAANTGKVVFAEYLGIYGNTIIIDHGQGLFSIYSHLSSFQAQPGLEVKKGEVIGRTGATGLAGGDHLHFGMIVHNTFIDPKEWWDSHWIRDNITIKLKHEESH